MNEQDSMNMLRRSIRDGALSEAALGAVSSVAMGAPDIERTGSPTPCPAILITAPDGSWLRFHGTFGVTRGRDAAIPLFASAALLMEAHGVYSAFVLAKAELARAKSEIARLNRELDRLDKALGGAAHSRPTPNIVDAEVVGPDYPITRRPA